MKKVFSLALSIVIVAAVSARAIHAWADETPPRQVEESADSIHKNQKRIADIRKYVDEFETLKSDNARLVGRMEAFGYTMDWSKNQPVKLEGF